MIFASLLNRIEGHELLSSRLSRFVQKKMNCRTVRTKFEGALHKTQVLRLMSGYEKIARIKLETSTITHEVRKKLY